MTLAHLLIGIGLAVFSASTTAINTFKPQPVHIHLVFLVVISYVLGEGLARIIPRRGRIGRFLNPFPVSATRATPLSLFL
jgi:hypothetical protein